jgi:hypothetical protein
MKMAGAELDTNVLSELETNYNRAELGTKPHGVLDMTEVPTTDVDVPNLCSGPET